MLVLKIEKQLLYSLLKCVQKETILNTVLKKAFDLRIFNKKIKKKNLREQKKSLD